MMRVPFFDAAATVSRRWEALADRLSMLDPAVLVDGPAVADLERSIARYTGARHCVAVGSGTDALAIMLKAAGIGPGDEIIVPAYSFFATASTVVHVGATPVFVDVSPDTYALDPARIEAAVTPRTRAVMPVHLFCQMAPMRQLQDIARRHGLLLLEDSAEAIGMRAAGRHAGTLGDAGVLSFFPTKTLGAFGDAGMILTNNRRLAAATRALADGSAGDGAWASSCDELQAAVLLFRLDLLDAEIARRAELAQRYHEGLAGIAGVTVPRVHGTDPPVWYVYLVTCERRDELAAELAARGVETEVYYPWPLPQQPCFASTDAVAHPIPVSEESSSRALALPLYPDMADAQVDRVCRTIADFFGGANV